MIVLEIIGGIIALGVVAVGLILWAIVHAAGKDG